MNTTSDTRCIIRYLENIKHVTSYYTKDTVFNRGFFHLFLDQLTICYFFACGYAKVLRFVSVLTIETGSFLFLQYKLYMNSLNHYTLELQSQH